MNGLSTEQNVHKSMNIIHDLATLIVFIIVLFLPVGWSLDINVPDHTPEKDYI